ncbi:MAG: carbon-nitrogen hydrolase [Gammaproteobacteria bacterium]|nr:carbon-nitrogen hydrolase [Gammaproteobacteria bacterium]
MTSRTINLALIQSQCFDNADENRQYIKTQLKQAAANNAELVLLQELHNTPYFCIEEKPSNFDLAETIPGESTEFFSALAKELSLVIVCSLFEKRSAGLYHNTAVVFDKDGSIAGKYRKMHIPDDPGFYEKYYFTPGDLGFSPIQTSIGKLGVLICWDQWFPEAARLMALAGAEILLYPTAIGWDPNDSEQEQQRQLDAWTTIQRSHAIANGLAVASCNRCGDEGNGELSTRFWGNSFICGPQGEMLTQAASNTNEILQYTIELEKTESVRRIWPYLRDRRIDAYQDLNKRLIDQ